VATKLASTNVLAANSKKKPRGKAFAAGKSGNPAGRPKRTEEELDLIAACKSKTVDALERIERLMTTARSDSVQLSAATFIIERAYGKAVQPTDNKHTGTVAVLVNTDQAARIAKEVLSGLSK